MSRSMKICRSRRIPAEQNALSGSNIYIDPVGRFNIMDEFLFWYGPQLRPHNRRLERHIIVRYPGDISELLRGLLLPP